MILTILFTIVHVLVCLFLILVVLAQQGKGQDIAAAFGGTGSQTAFGARGTATLLSKITAGAAAVFMITSLTLTYLRPAATGGTVVPDLPAPTSETTTPSEEPPPTEEPPASETPTSETPPGQTSTAPETTTSTPQN